MRLNPIRSAALLFVMALMVAPVGAQSGKPNVVFIFADQHRGVSFPGEPNTSVIAPALDRLANEGAFFENAISNYPVCSPFRAMLMSARAPFKTGVVENRIPLRENGNSFGNVFQQAGYRTGYIGKWHLGGIEKEARPGTHGFEFFEPWQNTSRHRRARFWDRAKSRYVSNPEYNAITMTDHALAFI
ncbi:MAG: sulfatase-like hydrolase/transferase, partial [bacterium]|nr:sulfatase-like hydrolase/transferase [bacterium]